MTLLINFQIILNGPNKIRSLQIASQQQMKNKEVACLCTGRNNKTGIHTVKTEILTVMNWLRVFRESYGLKNERKKVV